MQINIGTYDGGKAGTGGSDYEGWIEPENKQWIIFIHTDGRADFHPKREENGAVGGEILTSYPRESDEGFLDLEKHVANHNKATGH